MTEPLITMRHVRALRGRGVTCTPGIRAWAAQHRIDLRAFNRDGIAGEEALRINDAFSLRLLEIARKEATDGR